MNDLVLPPRYGLSLCSGGGGLDLGLELACPGFASSVYVEWEQYPRDCLIAAQRAGYLPPAPIWDNVKSFDGRAWRGVIDTVLAGYPCQPFSQAGQRKGADDPRHLWPDIARIIDQARPRWVWLENVAGHVTLGAETVLRELHEMGFATATGLFSASETGAPHERLRWFTVAYADGPQQDAWKRFYRERRQQIKSGQGGKQLVETGADRRDVTVGRGGTDVGHAHGARQGQAGCRPDVGSDQQQRRQPVFGDGFGDVAHTGQSGLQGRECDRPSEQRHWPQTSGSTAQLCRPQIYPPGPGDADGWDEVLRDYPELAPAISVCDVKRACDHFAALVAQGHMAQEEAESVICKLVAGLSSRSPALKLLGNAVAPLTAALAWRTLSSAHGLRTDE